MRFLVEWLSLPNQTPRSEEGLLYATVGPQKCGRFLDQAKNASI